MKKIQKYASSLYSGGSDAPDIPVQRYSAPPFVDSGRRKFLSVLEIIFSCFVVLIVAYWQLFSTVFYNSHTLYRHPMGAMGYLGLGMVVLIPLLFLIALWKKSLAYAKYGFLGLGILALASILPMLFIAVVFPDEPLSKNSPAESYMPVRILIEFFTVPLLGLGCLWRYWCMKNYACSSYLTMLLLQHRATHCATRRTIALLLLYFTLYVIFPALFEIL